MYLTSPFWKFFDSAIEWTCYPQGEDQYFLNGQAWVIDYWGRKFYIFWDKLLETLILITLYVTCSHIGRSLEILYKTEININSATTRNLSGISRSNECAIIHRSICLVRGSRHRRMASQLWLSRYTWQRIRVFLCFGSFYLDSWSLPDDPRRDGSPRLYRLVRYIPDFFVK